MTATTQKKEKLGIAHRNFDWKKSEDMGQALYGKAAPQALKFEEAVLGAIMLDRDAFKTVNFLKADDFYNAKHRNIYLACEQLDNGNIPIDMLMVSEQINKMKIKNREHLPTPYDLATITGKVASSANIEYHARIIQQKSLARTLIEECSRTIQDCYQESKDIFRIYDDMQEAATVQHIGGLLVRQGFGAAIKEADNQPDRKMLCGNLLHTNQVGVFFGPSGTGKSILAVQMADALTKGKDVIQNILINECDPMKVLYIDFELNELDIKGRYANPLDGGAHDFDDEMLIRYTINKDFLDFEADLDKLTLQEIEKIIVTEDPECIIIDNLTFLTQEDASDAKIAGKIIKRLLSFKRKYNKTLLIIGHTPKILPNEPIEKRHLRGSGLLSDLIDKLFAINNTCDDVAVKYIKELKSRGSQETYHKENILLLERERGGKQGAAISFKHFAFGKERDYLSSFMEEDTQDTYIEAAIEHRMNKGWSWNRIKSEIGFPQSGESLRLKVESFVRGSTQYELQKDGKKNIIVKTTLQVLNKDPYIEDNKAMQPAKTDNNASIPF